MRLPVLIATLGIVGVLGGGVHADDPGDPADHVAPEQVTTVDGAAPDLEGRWLLLVRLGMAQGKGRVLPAFWDVARKGGALEIDEHFVELPAAQSAAIQSANDGPEGRWDPTPADLDAIRTSWSALPVVHRGIDNITHKIAGRDGFNDDLKNDTLAREALWAVRQVYTFLPGGSRPVTQANLIAPTTAENGGFSGNYLTVTLANAPFPIPIKFQGTFRLIPLEKRQASIRSRLADFFVGCGRRP